MEGLRKLRVKNWKETAKDRRNGRDLAERVKNHKGLYTQVMMMMMMMMMMMNFQPTTFVMWEPRWHSG